MEDTRYKTFWRRFGAMWIDGFMFKPLALITPNVMVGSSFGLVIWACVLSLIPIIYNTAMHARYGQTVGKMVCGVMVIDLTQTRALSTKQAILRDSLSYGFSAAAFVLLAMIAAMDSEGDRWAALAFGFGLGFAVIAWSLGEVLTTLTNSRRRSLHDFIAGTLVVKLNQLSGDEVETLKSTLPSARSQRSVRPESSPAQPSGRGW